MRGFMNQSRQIPTVKISSVPGWPIDLFQKTDFFKYSFMEGPLLSLEGISIPYLKKAGDGSVKKRIAVSALGTGSGRRVAFDCRPVDAPLPKIYEDRIKRKAAYKQVSKDISKWLPVVVKNRVVMRFY